MAGTQYLVVVYVVTAGLHGDDLGSDEEEMMLFAWLVVDINDSKVSLFLDLPNTYFIVLKHTFIKTQDTRCDSESYNEEKKQSNKKKKKDTHIHLYECVSSHL